MKAHATGEYDRWQHDYALIKILFATLEILFLNFYVAFEV